MQGWPDWNAIHPLVVHFPIALLLVAPVLALVGVAANQRAFLVSALLLMSFGTAAAWLAVATGEAASEVAKAFPHAEAVLDRHQDLAETACTLATVVTLVYAALLFAPVALKRPLRRAASLAAHVGFLAVYAVTAVHLVQTAHHGGVLVHQLGVHAGGAAPLPAAESAARPDDD
ncbi:MAG: DUF2231 domain-containing protein [Myxococcales bacterium]